VEKFLSLLLLPLCYFWVLNNGANTSNLTGANISKSCFDFHVTHVQFIAYISFKDVCVGRFTKIGTGSRSLWVRLNICSMLWFPSGFSSCKYYARSHWYIYLYLCVPFFLFSSLGLVATSECKAINELVWHLTQVLVLILTLMSRHPLSETGPWPPLPTAPHSCQRTPDQYQTRVYTE